jgi:hypothetical protein
MSREVLAWADVQAEAREIVTEAAGRGALLRLVGSAGIRMHCAQAEATLAALGRPAARDIDAVCRRSDRNQIRTLLEERGYETDRDVLVALEGTRFVFRRPDGLEIDLFVDRLEFCHTIELGQRLDRHQVTIPIEDLLLQKLQIVEQMPSDITDTAALLATHDVGDSDDPEVLDRRYISRLLGRDWGFHRTVVGNLEKLETHLAAGEVRGLTIETKSVITQRVKALLEAIDAAPKSLAWKVRAKVGERVAWWEDVQEERGHY